MAIVHIDINLSGKCCSCGGGSPTQSGLCLSCISLGIRRGDYDHIIKRRTSTGAFDLLGAIVEVMSACQGGFEIGTGKQE